MSSTDRTSWPSILRFFRYWSYAWQRNGGWEHGYHHGCRGSTELTQAQVRGGQCSGWWRWRDSTERRSRRLRVRGGQRKGQYETRQVKKVDRVTQQLSTKGTDPSVPLASDPDWNTTTRLQVYFGDMKASLRV